MKDEKYFIIKNNGNGDIGIYEHSEKEVLKMLREYKPVLSDIISALKGNHDPMYWVDSILIIKGKIVVPKPKETIRTWEIE